MKTEIEFRERLKAGSNGCVEWSGAVDTGGYGHLRWRGRIVRAHRVAYEFAFGPIPDGDGHHGAVVRHSCDNRLCCNPDHLKLGTHADNMADMKARRRRKGIGTGADNGRAKLTAEQVIAIRADVRGKRVIAKDYGISPAQAQRVRLGKQWSDLSSYCV